MTPAQQTNRERFESMVERGEKLLGLVNKLIWGFAVTIFSCIVTITALIYQQAHNHKDIEYVRDAAAPKVAVMNLEKIHLAETAAYKNLITDPEKKSILEAVERKTIPIIESIIMWNNTIYPRGSVQSKNVEAREETAKNNGLDY